VGITFKGLSPQPVPLFPGSNSSLFNSVFHFSASLNRTKDWVWPPDSTPKSLSHWLVLGAGDSAKQQLWVPDDRVAEGWYNIAVRGARRHGGAGEGGRQRVPACLQMRGVVPSAARLTWAERERTHACCCRPRCLRHPHAQLEASISTDYPSLVSLGMPVVDKYDEPSLPQQLADRDKLLATPQYSNGTLVRWLGRATPVVCACCAGQQAGARVHVQRACMLLRCPATHVVEHACALPPVVLLRA
jgi:hypothetical protein